MARLALFGAILSAGLFLQVASFLPPSLQSRHLAQPASLGRKVGGCYMGLNAASMAKNKNAKGGKKGKGGKGAGAGKDNGQPKGKRSRDS